MGIKEGRVEGDRGLRMASAGEVDGDGAVRWVANSRT